MKRILMVDNQAICRDLLAALLSTKGFACTTCSTALEAVVKLQAEPPDLVVVELDLPEMTGLSFIESIRRAERTVHVPVIVLTNSRDKSNVVRAAALGIHGYFLKNAFSVDRFVSRLRELVEEEGKANGPESGAAKAPPTAHARPPAQTMPAVVPPVPHATAAAPHPAVKPPAASGPKSAVGRQSAEPLPRLLTREQTILRLDQVAGGKTIAGVVAQVIALANSPEADLGEMVRVLESDPVLATRVMQGANSASAGARTRVRTVEDAVRSLGMREIRNLAMNIGIFGSFPPNETDGFNTLRCWQHSFAVAELIGMLAHEKDHYQACVNHLAGLCHDLGEILLRQHFAAEYARILAYAIQHGMDAHEVENVALGIRHPELVSRLLSRIGLPQPVVHAIREFHERQVKGQAAGMSRAAQVLLMANQLAHGMLLAASSLETVQPISRLEWRSLSAEKTPPAFDLANKRNEILLATNMLAKLPASDERELLAPVVQRQARRVWYLRPENFIELDPLAMALTMMCEARVSSSPPTAEDWMNIDGLVAVGIRPGVPPVIPEELAQQRAAAGRSDVPVLILTGQESPPTREPGVMVRDYPARLADLEQWLKQLKRSNQRKPEVVTL